MLLEKTFIPVDSYYEREVLRRLFALQFEWTQKGLHLEIIKPLFDIEIEVDDSQSENGGFTGLYLRTSEKQLIIEVNGSMSLNIFNETTSASKNGQIRNGLVFDAYGAEKEDHLNFKISRIIVQIKNHLINTG